MAIPLHDQAVRPRAGAGQLMVEVLDPEDAVHSNSDTIHVRQYMQYTRIGIRHRISSRVLLCTPIGTKLFREIVAYKTTVCRVALYTARHSLFSIQSTTFPLSAS